MPLDPGYVKFKFSAQLSVVSASRTVELRTDLKSMATWITENQAGHGFTAHYLFCRTRLAHIPARP